MAEIHEQVARVAQAAEKLLRETERLRRDVARSYQRIEPFDGEVPLADPSIVPRTRIRNLKDALDVIERSSRTIVACEGRLGHMEAILTNIAEDTHSREDMKPWLKERSR